MNTRPTAAQKITLNFPSYLRKKLYHDGELSELHLRQQLFSTFEDDITSSKMRCFRIKNKETVERISIWFQLSERVCVLFLLLVEK